MTPLMAMAALWAAFFVSWTAAAIWATRTVIAMPSREMLPLAFAGAVAVALLLALGQWAPAMRVPLWEGSVAFAWTMVILCAAGLAFCWWARIHLGQLWSAGVSRKEGHRVVDTGPYGIVRHPIYTGVFLGAIAFAAVRATPMAIGAALVVIVLFTCKAFVEERFLRREFGAGYEDYARRVPMLVPRPKRPERPTS